MDKGDCELIPIRTIGYIQDYGVVLAVENNQIVAISDNAHRYPWIMPNTLANMIGKRVHEVFNAKTIASIQLILHSAVNIILSGRKFRKNTPGV